MDVEKIPETISFEAGCPYLSNIKLIFYTWYEYIKYPKFGHSRFQVYRDVISLSVHRVMPITPTDDTLTVMRGKVYYEKG